MIRAAFVHVVPGLVRRSKVISCTCFVYPTVNCMSILLVANGPPRANDTPIKFIRRCNSFGFLLFCISSARDAYVRPPLLWLENECRGAPWVVECVGVLAIKDGARVPRDVATIYRLSVLCFDRAFRFGCECADHRCIRIHPLYQRGIDRG